MSGVFLTRHGSELDFQIHIHLNLKVTQIRLHGQGLNIQSWSWTSSLNQGIRNMGLDKNVYAKEKKIIDGVGNYVVQLWVRSCFQLQHT